MPPLSSEQVLENVISRAIEQYALTCELSNSPLWLSFSVFGVRIYEGTVINVSVQGTIYPDGGEMIRETSNSPKKGPKNE